VILRDNNAFGFYTTVATLVRREGDTWYTNRPHNHDYAGANGGVVETLFPVVSAVDVNDAVLEGVYIEGNSRQNPVTVNGCRAGGFLALRAHRLKIRGVVVRDYNGDGIGFQTCDDMDMTDCLVEQCTGVGFHPGSGSNRFHLRRCTARKNGSCGLFYCLRVRHGLLEDSVFENNGSHGVSIGSRDTDSVNRHLTIRGNGGAGVYLRPSSHVDAAHNSVIEGCTLERNCRGKVEADAEIVLQGETEGIRVIGNTIRRKPEKAAILIRKEVRSCEIRGNRIQPSGKDAVQDLSARKRSR
jgi:nitrous oxidase accessory protein NosD